MSHKYTIELENISSCIDMQTHAGNSIAAHVTNNRVTLTFDLWVNACWAIAIEYMCTKFGADSSSRFPFRVQTNRQTDRQTEATECRTHAGGYATAAVPLRHENGTVPVVILFALVFQLCDRL